MDKFETAVAVVLSVLLYAAVIGLVALATGFIWIGVESVWSLII